MLEAETAHRVSTLVPRIQVGTIVLGNTYATLGGGQMAAQVNHSGGAPARLGAGWQRTSTRPTDSVLHDARLGWSASTSLPGDESLWTRPSTFKGRYYTLSDAPRSPSGAKPHPELMIGGGGEKMTLPRWPHSDHWNVWADPRCWPTRADPDEHCGAAGAPQNLAAPPHCAPITTEGRGGGARRDHRLRMGPRSDARTRAGRHAGPDPETLAELRAAKVETVFIPSLFRPLPELRPDLDRFIEEIAPAFR